MLILSKTSSSYHMKRSQMEWRRPSLFWYLLMFAKTTLEVMDHAFLWYCIVVEANIPLPIVANPRFVSAIRSCVMWGDDAIIDILSILVNSLRLLLKTNSVIDHEEWGNDVLLSDLHTVTRFVKYGLVWARTPMRVDCFQQSQPVLLMYTYIIE